MVLNVPDESRTLDHVCSVSVAPEKSKDALLWTHFLQTMSHQHSRQKQKPETN